MNRIVITLVACVFLLRVTEAQTPYYDALTLKDRQENGKIILTNQVQELLVKYYPGKTKTDITAILLNSNVFFKDLFQDKAEDDIEDAAISKVSKSFSLSSLGGFSVTNFADGLAKFLVKRFKEELSIGFFEKFKFQLNGPSHVELQIIFSQTSKVLKVADKDIYNFSIYTNTLREAFIKDLTNLYKNFKKIKDLPKYQDILNKPENAVLKTLVSNAFYLIDQFTNGVHPGAVIANYNPDELINFPKSDINQQINMRSSIKILKIFSNSFKSGSADNYWVPADSVSQIFADEIKRNLYFGFICQQSDPGIKFGRDLTFLTFRQILEKAKDTETEIGQFKNHVETIISHAQEVNEYITSIREKPKSEIDYNDYYKLFNASLDIISDGMEVVNLPAININQDLLDSIRNKTSKLLNLARNTAELYVDIRTKNYSSAVLNTITLMDSIFVSGFDSKLRASILKYGNFAASMAVAKNSDEVEKAIEAVALPAGSARIKRETPVNISLNAYVGGMGGWEYLPVLKQRKTSAAAAFTAQAGIAFSFGDKWRGKKESAGGKSITIFVPVIDVGALASFRLHDDSSKVASEVKFKNIIAPGLFVYIGLGKCPVSIGAGAQLGPQLREVTAKEINTEKNYYIRYGISVCVDIPILNFYTKSK